MTILGVIGPSGGVGCSTVVAALGIRAAQAGVRVAVVDGDPLRGGLQVTMAAEHLPGHRWSHLVEVDGEVGGERLLNRLPTVEGCAVLSGGRASSDLEAVVPEQVPDEAFEAVLAALDRACDLVVIDWGRVARLGWGASVLILPVTARGLADAQAWLGGNGHEGLAGVVTRGSGREQRIADDLARGLGLPLLGHLRDDRSVRVAERQGVPPGLRKRGGVARLADSLVASVLAVADSQAGDPVGSRV